ncbi:MAG TPA: DUF72 domain-containing protein [Saprospiraceae bacterium]|nr:DUF72 domain-containing protein [Saprospiraceae bacterium]
MKFGKLADISTVDFQLPADAPFNQQVYTGQQAPQPVPFYIGCTGYSMKEWTGKVYPKGTKNKDYLHHYTRQFNTIEHNTTHYRIPEPDTINKWRDEAPSDFRYCPKIPQRISHSRDLGMGSQELRLFWERIGGLEDRLGCCFIQLPPHFAYKKLPLLREFLNMWPPSIPLAVEVRHETWFAEAQRTEDWLQVLRDSGKTAVITDVSGRRDVLHMGLSNLTTMIRFVGNGLHPSDYSRIDEWLNRLSQWIDQGLREVYFFPHEPDNILAPELASYLHSQAQLLPNVVTRGPKLIEPDPEQLRLF